MKTIIQKLDGNSLDLPALNRAKLKALFPSVFTETVNNKGEMVESVDFDKLKAELGTFTDFFENRRERYGMDWPGKKEALHMIQMPTGATLNPCREESVNFDTTENLFIEGDNLEVLKLLQKSYYGKIKMIYIDPPYNTGNDFIYPDNFSEPLETYLKYAGLSDSNGKRSSTNTSNEGRFHTKWLNMMYPRLYLARNLLRDDGVIFISIDDNEANNLRKLCDEVFGEENFLSQIIWKNGRTAASHFTNEHEYILCFAKNAHELPFFNYLGDKIISDRTIKKFSEKNPYSEISFPKGIDFECEDKVFPKEIGETEATYITKGNLKCTNGKLNEAVTIKAAWTMKDMIESWLSGKSVTDQKGQKIQRFFFKSNGILQYEKEKSTLHPKSIIDSFPTKTGTNTLKDLLGNSYVEYPKPVELIRNLISYISEPNDIILDFFAGSATTAHAVLDLNKQDGGNRKFILVQLPEPCSQESEAFKAEYKNIADIGKERIRRVIKKLDVDCGFKVFKLSKSNFKKWNKLSPEATVDEIENQLELHVQHIHNHTQEDLLYEILIKSGFTLTEKIEIKVMADKQVFSIDNDRLIICFEDKITKELINEVIKAKPEQFQCLDSAFNENDQLKANIIQTFTVRNMNNEKTNPIIFKTI